NDKPIILASNAKFRKAMGFEGAEDEKWLAPEVLAKSNEMEKLARELTATKPADYTEIQREGALVFSRMRLLRQLREGEDELGLVPHFKEAEGRWIPVGILRQALNDPKEREMLGKAYDVAKSQEVVRSFDALKQAYIKREGVEKPAQELHDALAA